MFNENINKSNIESEEKKKPSQENIVQKEISQEELVNWLDQEKESFKKETQIELNKLNSVDLDQNTFNQIKDEVDIDNSLENIDSEMDQIVLNTKENLNNEEGSQIEIKKEFVDEIINNENIRYKSEESLSRAKKIDESFPPTVFEKIFYKYRLQEKNIDFVGNNEQNITIGDWLDEGMGGYYREQPLLVSRKKDLIELNNKADPDQMTQILQHEYNHMFTQGQSNFSKKYKEYIRSIFFDEKELKELSNKEGNEILKQEPFSGSGPVYKYLTYPAEINAYIGTNLRHDLLRSGIIKNFYDNVDQNIIEQALTVKDSNCNRDETPIYEIYLKITKDKGRLIEWLNNYAI